MRAKKTLLWAAILFVILWTLFDAANRPTQAQSETAAGASGSDSEAVLAKLDLILSNQKSVMSDLASMKEELRIIKIRITQQQ